MVNSTAWSALINAYLLVNFLVGIPETCRQAHKSCFAYAIPKDHWVVLPYLNMY